MHMYANVHVHLHKGDFLSVHYEQICSLCARLFEQTQEGYAEQVNVPPESQCDAGSVAQP